MIIDNLEVKKLRYIIGVLMLCVAVVAGAANKNFTLVIDPGHGGGDAGAVGAISK